MGSSLPRAEAATRIDHYVWDRLRILVISKLQAPGIIKLS
jgi:hypothetical protein